MVIPMAETSFVGATEYVNANSPATMAKALAGTPKTKSASRTFRWELWRCGDLGGEFGFTPPELASTEGSSKFVG